MEAHGAHVPETLCQIVDEGLSLPQKTLPCRYFYDTAGSRLFEQICRLPEYYLTRTEQAILERHAIDMLVAAGDGLAMVEFGSGSSYKTRILMNAALARQRSLHYIPIDISTAFLRESAETLLEEYGQISVTAIAGEYRDGIEVLPAHDGPRLILFLGSNVGNFEADEAVAFLAAIRSRMEPHDRILIGVDLVKDRAILHAAYNDSRGITAEFNKNLLHRINGELGGDFHIASFEHTAPFVEERSRIEMRLVSRSAQTVRIRATDHEYAFAAGEFIHTENSHKYTVDGFAGLCSRAGLGVQEQWLDGREWFGVLLLQPMNCDPGLKARGYSAERRFAA
jgi:L-histidine N-alpha-methyltransferase